MFILAIASRKAKKGESAYGYSFMMPLACSSPMGFSDLAAVENLDVMAKKNQ
jgi:hypothetical protein